MVLRRSTTDWACDTALSSVPRSMLNFMPSLPDVPRREAHRSKLPYPLKQFRRFSAQSNRGSRPPGAGVWRLSLPARGAAAQGPRPSAHPGGAACLCA
jgi:hypothetical protein